MPLCCRAAAQNPSRNLDSAIKKPRLAAGSRCEKTYLAERHSARGESLNIIAIVSDIVHKER